MSRSMCKMNSEGIQNTLKVFKVSSDSSDDRSNTSNKNKGRSFVYSVWNKTPLVLQNTQLTLIGHSVAGFHTGFYIPQLKVAFDAGLRYNFQPNYIFITHCHTDHSFMLPMNLTGLTKQPKVCVPIEQVELFTAFNDTAYRMAKNDASLPSPLTFNGVKAGDIFELCQNYYVEVFELDHSTEARGYGIFEKRKKLKEIYRGLPIAELKLVSDEEKYEIQVVKLVAYLTDTTPRVFDLNVGLFEYKNIIVECTYWDDDMINKAVANKHTHWIDLKPIVEANSDTNFVLMHISPRYKKEFIDEMAKSLPRNCQIFN